MSLVAYCVSDDSGSDNENEQANESNVLSKAVLVPNGESNATVGEASTSSPRPGNSLTKKAKPTGARAKEGKLVSLPLPKMKSINCDLRVIDKKRTQPVRIPIPELKALEKYEEPDKKPKLKRSTKGSGLFSLLPEPKNVVTSVAKVLMPQPVTSVKKTLPKKLIPMKAMAKKQKSSILDDEDEGGSEPLSSFFFSSSDDVLLPPLDIPMFSSDISSSISTSSNLISDISGTVGLDTSMQSQAVVLHPPSITNPNLTSGLAHTSEIEEPSLDSAALLKLCGARERKKGPDLSEMIDVSGSSLVGDSSLQLAKELSKEQPTHSFKRKSECSSLQRRKHQITYLAEQAKAQELELRNNWAQNRMTRKQTQAKYGF